MKKFRHSILSFFHNIRTGSLILNRLCFLFFMLFIVLLLFKLRHTPISHTFFWLKYYIGKHMRSTVHNTPFAACIQSFPTFLPHQLNRHMLSVIKSAALSSAYFAFALLAIPIIIRQNTRKKQTMHPTSFLNIKYRLAVRRKLSPITMDKLPFPKGFETKHMLIIGTTGAGKTNALNHLIRNLRSLGHSAIVMDSTALFAQAWWRDGDIYLNPNSPRSAAWSFFDDYTSEEDFDHFSHAMLPAKQLSEPFWNHASQAVLSAICQISFIEGIPKLRELLFETPLPDLVQILSHTRARMVLTKEADKTAGSIVAHLTAGIQSLRYLKTPEEITKARQHHNRYCRRSVFTSDVPTLSIKKWVHSPGKSWLFLSTAPQDRAAFIPLLRSALDTAIRTLMSRNLNDNQATPMWIILDELPSLGHLPSLATIAAEGRKYGVSIVACIQSLGQLEGIYGRTGAQSFLDLFGTKIIFRTPNADSAQWISRLFGTADAPTPAENLSLSSQKNNISWSGSVRESKEEVISATEIMSLKDLQAFVKYPGTYPPTRVTMRYLSPSLHNEWDG